MVLGPPGPLFHAMPVRTASEVIVRSFLMVSDAACMSARERVFVSVLSTVETKICPRWPKCGREFQPASFEEDRVMSKEQATKTVVRIEAMAGNVRWPLRTASRRARRMLIDARPLGTRQRVNT